MKSIFKIIVKAGKIYLIANGIFWIVLGAGQWAGYSSAHWKEYKNMTDRFEAFIDDCFDGYKKFIRY